MSTRTLDLTWPADEGPGGLEAVLHRLCGEAEQAADDGVRILILSDRGVDHARVAVPALLATGAVHHRLVRAAKRMRLSIVVDTGEARDVHQVSCLFGFGAQAVCPYLAAETVRELLQKDTKGDFAGLTLEQALQKFRGALEKGVLKIMSKMGISCLSSYQGAQIFEAVGLSIKVVDMAFAGTPSQIEGIGFDEIAHESLARHRAGFGEAVPQELKLGDPGYLRFRQDGERHGLPNPMIKNFHTFVRENDPANYRKVRRRHHVRSARSRCTTFSSSVRRSSVIRSRSMKSSRSKTSACVSPPRRCRSARSARRRTRRWRLP